MTTWYLWIPFFLLLGAPTGLLMLDRTKGYPASRFLRTQGWPALAVFVALLSYASWSRDPTADLIIWGVVAGVLATIALDAVRLVGVALRAFPMDMPRMFGLILLGLAPLFQANIMARLVGRLAEEAPERRERLLRERMTFLSQLPPWRRRAMMRGMMKGLQALPATTGQEMRTLQMGILASLPEASRANLMRTMDELMVGNPERPARFLDAVRSGSDRPSVPPPIPMRAFNGAADEVFRPTLSEGGRTFGAVLTAGYLYHFANGITYAGAYFVLFGRGSWALAFAWGIFVWLVMMVAMPRMMPMIRFPKWFPVVPFLAHLAMAVPIGYVGQTFISSEASDASLVSGLGLGGVLRFLGLL